MPNAESDVREFLARIYELLRNQQQALFDLHISIAALETALRPIKALPNFTTKQRIACGHQS